MRLGDRLAWRGAWGLLRPLIVTVILFSAAAPASAQLSLPASSQTEATFVVRGVAAAHNPANNQFFVVGAQNQVTGIFTDANGVPVSGLITIKPTAPSGVPFGSFPRVCYSADVNNGLGGFLVAWAVELSNTTQMHTQIFSTTGAPLGSEATVTGATAWKDIAGAAVSYSKTSKVFLIVWKTSPVAPGASIRVQRVGINGSLIGSPVQVSTGFGRDPGVTWNPNNDEFGVSFAGETSSGGVFTSFVRVPANNPSAFARTTFNNLSSGVTAVTDISFNPTTNLFVLSWWEASGGTKKAKIAEIDQAGNVVAAGVASFLIGSYDALSADYNPISKTFLMAGLNGLDDVLAAELNTHGVRIGTELIISDSPTTLPARYTRVSSSQTGARWLTVFNRQFHALLGQAAVTSTTGGGPAGTHPAPGSGGGGSGVPPPPPPTGGGGGSGPAVPTGQSVSPLNATLGDYDGDGKADPTVFRNSSGAWSVRQSSSGLLLTVPWGNGTTAIGDIPVPADYDGDGKTDVAVYRRTTGDWFVLKSAGGVISLTFGTPASFDVPVPGDYDHDGKFDIATYRRTTGAWNIIRSSNNTQFTLNLGVAANGDVPVPADYDGDGITDIAVYRTSTGQYLVRQSITSTTITTNVGAASVDFPVPADYDGDGKTDLGVFNISTNAATTGQWHILLSGGGQLNLQWGAPALGDVPVPGKYFSATTAAIGVFRRSTGQWFLRQANGTLLPAFTWGSPPAGDIVRGQ